MFFGVPLTQQLEPGLRFIGYRFQTVRRVDIFQSGLNLFYGTAVLGNPVEVRLTFGHGTVQIGKGEDFVPLHPCENVSLRL